jgi:Reverse transcriptase (RNA-dependent DNA polymerase)
VVLIYVDDLIIDGNNLEEIKRVKDKLKEMFDIKDLGLLKYFFRNRNYPLTERYFYFLKKICFGLVETKRKIKL